MLPDFLLPHNAVDTRNPIFRHMWLHLRLINSEQRLKRYNQLILIGLPFIILIWWLIERLHINFGYMQPDISYTLINIIVFIALCVMLALSLYSIPTILGTFHTQFNSGYWDALRLTPQYNSAILMSHDAIAQLRLWPITAAEVGLRITIVAQFILNNFYNLYHEYNDKSDFLSQTLFSPLCLMAWGVIALVGLAFILEPIIRARVIITLHLLIAIYIRHAPLAVLTGFAALLLIHASQAVLIASLWAMSEDFARQEMGGFAIILCLIPLTLLAAIIFWAFYAWLRKFTLALAYKSAFRQD